MWEAEASKFNIRVRYIEHWSAKRFSELSESHQIWWCNITRNRKSFHWFSCLGFYISFVQTSIKNTFRNRFSKAFFPEFFLKFCVSKIFLFILSFAKYIAPLHIRKCAQVFQRIFFLF